MMAVAILALMHIEEYMALMEAARCTKRIPPDDICNQLHSKQLVSSEDLAFDIVSVICSLKPPNYKKQRHLPMPRLEAVVTSHFVLLKSPAY